MRSTGPCVKMRGDTAQCPQVARLPSAWPGVHPYIQPIAWAFMVRTIAFLLALLAAFAGSAQPPNTSCEQAALLCAQQPLAGNNTGAVGLPGFCPATNSLVWYTFTTNSQGGVAVIRLLDINCPAIPNMADELSIVVLSGDGSCAPQSFSAVSDCVSGDVPFNVTTQALMPDTRYWVVVAGTLVGGATIPAQCAFRIEVAGPGVDVIGIDFSAGPDQTIGEGEVTQLNAFGGPPYDWSPTVGLSGNTIANPFASPNGTTIYTVTTTINGCTFSDEVTVQVIRRIEPPNTFTPNDDGINDTWLIPGLAAYPGVEVLIYDRWGQLVFRSTGYRDPWDGTFNGNKVPEGTYYYHIQLNQLEGRSPPYTGFISIVR